ncbi:DNA-3-methyladenine glycosylase 2 family protein [Streptomyces sp. H10-C2]|uniref:DNA-3-methyladenine glycosylase family protein n=1 Tax=unclassified Streptomyces TaxID=2593676 RepID=UPI0024BA9795|nr:MULTISPECIES: DNA-3-methyladenine glycosylase 2 family protein [unclassified Streptomyces]MDJ0341261.1 DNA-3-methyladenine glycosylase 2 family protein [Streptomyces sp. PH10-H1]MDJ0370856.1 DNA-3-methyladenine glycosylase 2 family protein [Streptomyces sp. H10-C2]
MRTSTRHWTPGVRTDLGLTLGPLGRGPGDPAYQVAPDGAIWRAARTPAGPGTLRIGAAGGTVRAEAWGEGADWLLEALPALLGADDDPAPFTPRHRVVHEAHRRHPGLRLTRTGLVLESLIPSILEQKVTSDEAHRAWRLLLRRHGEPAPGPATGGPAGGMYVMPAPRQWSLIPSWDWHRAGVDNKRSATILRAVRVAARMEEAATMDLATASARLQAIPGIGPWTAAETLQRSNGAPDALTVGDLHLPNIIGFALTGAHRTDDAAMCALLAPYAGQRHRAARLILLSGRVPPRRAPRFAPNDIARI